MFALSFMIAARYAGSFNEKLGHIHSEAFQSEVAA